MIRLAILTAHRCRLGNESIFTNLEGARADAVPLDRTGSNRGVLVRMLLRIRPW